MSEAPSRPYARGRAADTRQRLLRAGREAFARHGLAGTSLKRDVLGRAGVSVGSFYHQFKDKTDLLLAILEEHSATQRRRFSAVHTPERGVAGEEIARRSYALAFDLADAHEEVWRILVRHRDDPDPRIRRFIEEDRSRWHHGLAGDYARLGEAYGFEIQVELAAELSGMLTRGAIQEYLSLPRGDRPKARQRMIDGLVRFTLAGLSGLAADDARPDTRPDSTQMRTTP